MAAPRKLAAILAADISGFSRLMGADEAGTAKALREHRAAIDPLVASHGGRIFKTTGDGVLLEFPSIVAAVECAVAVQKLMVERNEDVPENQRMLFRIGINLGDVLIEGDDILGDGVNVAARLESIAEPGGICISDDAYRQVQGKVSSEFVDLGEQQLKNIARPVRVYRAWTCGPAVSFASAPSQALLDKPSIAVMPFDVMRGSADDEAFADGLTEDIITAISRNRALFVIARNSSFTYKDKAIDIRQVGRDLGVRYVMEGSVRKTGDRLRVTIQLIEAASGNHIWAEKYDRPLTDIFDVQDDITRSVAASTQTHVLLEEGTRAERAERPELNVWLLTKRSWKRLYDLTPEALADAKALAERALELAPESALAHEILAIVLAHQFFMRTVPDGPEILLKAKNAAMKAARLAGPSEYTYWGLGIVQFFLGEPDQAILSFRQGLQINPNCTVIYSALGHCLALMGRADEGIVATELAMRTDPRDPSIFFRYQALADAYFVRRDFEKMVEWAAKGVAQKPGYFGCHLRLVVGLALLGRVKEMASAAERYLRDVPDEIRSRIGRRGGFVREQDIKVFGEGLKKARLARADEVSE